MPDIVNVTGYGARGDSATTVARRTGAYGAVSSDTDVQVLNKLVVYILSVGGLLLPENIFIDVALATAEAAVDEGTIFKLVDSASGTAAVRKRTAGGSDLLYEELTKARLGSMAGAGDIGTTSGASVEAQLDDKVRLNDDRPHRFSVDETNAQAFGQRGDSIADNKQVDTFFAYATIQNGGAGYGFHGIMTADASIAEGAAGGIGGAANGAGYASGVVGNRYEEGAGHGGVFSRVGGGDGNGVQGNCSTTGTGSAGYFIKQNPVSGIAGAGPGTWLLNNSDNGEAFRARSASNNNEAQTAIIDRENGIQGTGLLTRVNGGGARTALVRAAGAHVVPSVASTGAAQVIGQDVQINANLSGSADTRGINIANSSTGGSESYGGVIIVDGANTTNYGLFLNAANGTTNHAFYAPNGRISFGGDMLPLTDGTQNIGGGGARFGTIYAATGTINTSDATQKKWLGGLSDAHMRAGRRIIAEMGFYQWLDQIETKGEDGARIHFGVRAQEIARIFVEEGLEAAPAVGARPSFRHAFLCYDEWDDVMAPVMEDRIDADGVRSLVKVGERVAVPAGRAYGIRPDQLCMFLLAVQGAMLAQIAPA